MSKYLGDFSASSVIDFKFTTFRPSTGAPFTLAGTPVVSVYKDNDLVQTTTGVALTVDFDGVTGLNHVRVTTTDAFYANGSEFECVITTGTVDSVSVVGSCVGRFTLRSQASLYPTTAGNTLDVNANGEAGVDWGNVGNQGSTVGLSATTVNTSTNVTNAVTVGTINNNVITANSIATDALQASKFQDSALVIGNAAAGGVKAYLAANAVNSTVLANDAITAAKIATGAIDADAIATGAIDADAIASDAITAAKIASGAIDADAIATGAIDADAIAADAITSAKIADSAITIRLSTDGTASEGRLFAGAVASDVWNAAYASFTAAGTFGKLMDTLRKANFVIEGTTTAGSTTTSINTNLTGYVLNAFEQQTVLFISGTLAGSCGLISASSTGGVLTIDEALPGTPAAGVDFVILGTHVHTKNSIADGFLARDLGSGTNAGVLNERTVRAALRVLRNRTSITGTALTVTNETDNLTTGVAWTATLTTNPLADPVTGIDPA